ncbi:MAG: hypothetical protein K9M54_06710 [Kiritimatiellales bacterium]|nr:hypothetical protein [Kiritimatiellales bacterium]MCF7864157.1 hypothetical protein [Kiritimatiellales bacterium]
MRSASFQPVHARQDAWSAHLQDLFRSLEIPSNTLAENLAASIAMYCRQFHPRGLQSADLKLLIARAFCAVGERASAERVLQTMEPHRRHVSRWLEILSELHHFPELLPYFSFGIIRPADWAGARLDRMWTLDFGRLVLSESERHEMMLYRSIRTIIEKMFVFWDVPEGEGTLGLKGLASMNVEPKGRNLQTLTAKNDLLEYIADLFRRRQAERGWSTVPVLLNLDL